MDSVMLEISQQLDTIKPNLEDGVGAPTVMQLNPNMLPVLMSAVDIEGADSTQVTEFVEKTLIPELESIDGVASIDRFGEIEKEIKIKLDQNKIDEINDKMLENVSSELAKTKKDLDKAQREINNGKAELESVKKEKTQQIAEGLSAIESGRNEITKAEMELKTKEDEVVLKKSELEGNLAQLETAEVEISNKKTELEKQKTVLDQQINGLKSQKLPLEVRKKELEEKQINEPLTVAESLELNDAVNSINEIDASINAIESSEGYVALNSGLTQINEKYTEITTGKTQLTAGLDQINAGIAQMADAKNAINGKKEELNATSATLQVAQSTLVSETTKAETELEIAEKELKEGKTKFEDARDEAYKKASLDGIITIDLVSQILTAENFSMPAGTINDDITVKVGDKFSNIDEIKNLILFSFDMDGLEEIKLQDLATIEVANNSDEVYAKMNKNNGLILSFSKQSTASTKDVSETIQKRISQLEDKYENISFTNLMDQGIYIDMIIGSVMQSLIVGGILAIIVLFLFLKELKPTLIVAISIPVSLIFAVAMMYFSGVSINIMSLSGLALGVGMLVDNSIVVIENIFRLKKEGKETKEAAIQGAKTVTGAIIASTLTTICVFLPIVFVHGMSRQLFEDIGLTIAYALIASLIIALTVVPAMASKMFKKVADKENKFINKLTELYVKLLDKALRFKWIVILLVVVLLGTSIYLTTKMDLEFVPEVSSDEMEISLTMPEDEKLENIRNISDTVIDRLLTIDAINKIGALDNSSSTGGMMGASSKGISMYILLKEERTMNNDEVASKIKELTSDLNCEVQVSTSTMDMSAMMESGVSLKITGNDIDKLKEISADIESKIATVNGVGNIKGVKENSLQEKRIQVDKNKAMKNGLTVAQVYSEIASEIKPEIEGTKIEIESEEYQVIIQKSETDIIDVNNLMNIEFKVTVNEEEKTIKLSDIATVVDSTGLENITRENNSRYVTVTVTAADGASITQISRDVEKVLKDYQAPEGYKVSTEGEIDSIMEYMKDLVLMIIVAVLFIYLIMVAQFQSFKLPFIIMFTIPLAFTGGLFALFFTGKALSIIAMIGFLVLAGIVVNNGIVFIDCINQLREQGMERKEAIKLTGKLRLRPILMTAMTTILGMLSMALAIGKGSEMTQPLGIVSIGGLLYATILTLFFVPCLYEIFCKKK